MASKRIEIMDIRQLLELKIKGLSNRKSSELIGIHRNSVNYYVQLFKSTEKSYKVLLKLSDEELNALFPSSGTIDKQRYEELSSQFEYFRRELKKPGCTRQVLWQEYCVSYPNGYRYSQFNTHLGRWFKRKKVSGKLNHKAGDKIYIDYTGKKLQYIDKETGEVIEVEVFVAILPCSGYTFVEASPSQKSKDFIESMKNCFDFYGGVPQAIVTDNLKSAVTKGSKYAPVLNKVFKDFGMHYGCAISPTRTYSPQDKALVEGAVKIVYQRIFYPLSKMTFFSIKDLNGQISMFLKDYNNYLLSHINVSRHQQFTSIEQSYLSALPRFNYDIKTYKKVRVQQMGYVFLSEDKNYYSVPYKHVGEDVELRYTTITVEIYTSNNRIATHVRSLQRGKYNTIENHLSSSHQFYNKWKPEYFEGLAKKHGENVVEYVKKLINQKEYPEIAYKQCLGIFSLADKHEKGSLDAACKRGLGYPKYNYHIILSILKNKAHLLNLPNQDIKENGTQNIENKWTRGANHFKSLLKNMNLF